MKQPGRNSKETGFVLISVIMLTVILESYAATSLIGQLQDVRQARYTQLKAAALYAAQGIAERAASILADRVANFDVGSILPAQTYNITYADGRTTGTYQIRCAPPTSPATLLPNCPTYTLNEGGITKTVQDYEIIANVTHPDSSLSFFTPVNATSRIHQVVAAKKTTIFNYAIFYNSDLEMLPGPDMTMTGQIHANGSIYMGSNNTLTLDSTSVHATGDIYKHRKDSSETYGNTAVRIRLNGSSGACGSSTCPYVTFDNLATTNAGLSTTTWNGSVQGSGHGVGFIQPVTIPSIQPNGYYYNNAGLRIEASNSGLTVSRRNMDGSYTDITGSLPTGAVTNNVQFRNNRENSNYNVKVTDINLNVLRDGTCGGSACFPSNGLIYATRTDAVPASGQNSATSHGIRLLNGSDVAPTGSSSGLTVVTNNPLYVKGDFNTVNRKSVALISDAMNILSNNWSDSNAANLSARVATDTTVNAGFVSGIVPTDGSQYSGGFENYPRFLENWTNKWANIGGSFINVWDSQIGTGNWVYGSNQYNAPKRNWAYDAALQSSPPPFTPIGVEVEAKSWWQEAKDTLHL